MEIGIESIFSGTEKKFEWWLIFAAQLRLWSLKMVLPPSLMTLLARYVNEMNRKMNSKMNINQYLKTLLDFNATFYTIGQRKGSPIQ